MNPQLATQLRHLRLSGMAEALPLRLEQSKSAELAPLEFLELLVQDELVRRADRLFARRLKQAGIIQIKELSDFDFKAVPSLNKQKVLELSRCGFVSDRTNIVMVGPPGVGKSHLAISLSLSACRLGYRARFFTASSIVNTYREAREERVVSRLESSLRKLDVIVIDELGYLPIDQSGAESLFGFFSLCYEQVSVIVTTNLPFAQWPQTFAGDDRMTGALLDRLTHRVEILAIEGDSYRLKQSRKKKR